MSETPKLAPDRLVIGRLVNKSNNDLNNTGQANIKEIQINEAVFDPNIGIIKKNITETLQNHSLPANYRISLESALSVLNSDEGAEWLEIYREIAVDFLNDQKDQYNNKNLGMYFDIITYDGPEIIENDHVRLRAYSSTRSTVIAYNKAIENHPDKINWIQQIYLFSAKNVLNDKIVRSHGDILFDYNKLLASNLPSLILFNSFTKIESLMPQMSDFTNTTEDIVAEKLSIMLELAKSIENSIKDPEYIKNVFNTNTLIFAKAHLTTLIKRIRIRI